MTERGSVTTVVGDWDDVAPAVTTGTSQAEMSLLETETFGDRVVFQIRRLGGGSGTLTAVRLQPDGGDPGPIRLTARLGAFGDAEAEERLLRFVAARLRQLAGVEWAPL